MYLHIYDRYVVYDKSDDAPCARVCHVLGWQHGCHVYWLNMVVCIGRKEGIGWLDSLLGCRRGRASSSSSGRKSPHERITARVLYKSTGHDGGHHHHHHDTDIFILHTWTHREGERGRLLVIPRVGWGEVGMAGTLEINQSGGVCMLSPLTDRVYVYRRRDATRRWR